MKRSDEIAEKIVKRGYSNISSDEEYDHWINVVANDIEKYTTATLDTLKERANELEAGSEANRCDAGYYQQGVEDVLQLINEAINE